MGAAGEVIQTPAGLPWSQSSSHEGIKEFWEVVSPTEQGSLTSAESVFREEAKRPRE